MVAGNKSSGLKASGLFRHKCFHESVVGQNQPTSLQMPAELRHLAESDELLMDIAPEYCPLSVSAECESCGERRSHL
jgi:hypothetical protein